MSLYILLPFAVFNLCTCHSELRNPGKDATELPGRRCDKADQQRFGSQQRLVYMHVFCSLIYNYGLKLMRRKKMWCFIAVKLCVQCNWLSLLWNKKAEKKSFFLLSDRMYSHIGWVFRIDHGGLICALSEGNDCLQSMATVPLPVLCFVYKVIKMA